ncbi:MAG: reactive intermediate/imine deaminase [Alphaproteobacteria bacterium CG_4_10_14_0_2_um_filter_63_37]|nr:MAG: reactive intermediate/imine deaminase [Proteobacteria bacterium CG1_02_64_396]PJA25750.1 MAG: reactive intermediate/imine deaminase [Alphaproteobacteria bacterium CG_4_10_14_0_2_um_filter_63_37]
MSETIVATPHAPQAVGPYVQARWAGNLLYTSGQIALDPATGKMIEGDVVAQTERAMANLRAVLTAAGLDFTAVVKSTIFVTDLAHFAVVNAAYASALGDHRPARSTVQVAALPLGAQVEIEMVAMRG